ncbi:hypothetical protein [Lacipirellula sp.]|uniref:hypothetical protein n=1 Tax=Lacipirellula sp. TaxID=2691419 RepID=UPI003D0DAC46
MRRQILSLVAVCLAAPAASAQQLLPAAPAMPQQIVAPANLAPPVTPAQQEKLQLLRDCIAQRNQLQRRIDRIMVETQTPERMIVHLELLEVNLTAAEKIGVFPKAQDSPAGTTTFNSWTEADIAKLRSEDAVQVLASPKLEVSSGEESRSHFGPEANSENGAKSPFTDVQVYADALGNNQARVDFRIDRTTPDPERSAKDPTARTQVSTVNSQIEVTFGETVSLGGLITNRTRTRRGALGRVTETYKSEMVLLIRAEALLPHASGIVPATAIFPR